MSGAQPDVPPSAPVAPPVLGSADEASFAREAARVGLALPRAHPLNVWLALGIVVVIVAAAVGVGEYTGWAVGPRHATGGLTLYGAQDCSAAIAPVTVNLSGAVAADAGTPWANAFQGLGSDFAQWTGGCVTVAVAPSAGDGYVPDLSDRATYFAAAALPPNASDRASLPAAVATVPSALVAIEVVYDLPGVAAPLHLNASVIAGIYDGTVTAWDSPAITALNPGVDLAAAPSLTPLYRSGASAVNLPFTTYLADGSPTWSTDVGHGASVPWPVGVGTANATEMAAVISATPGAIGYVESIAPTPANGTVAALASDDGTFVLPTAPTVAAAATAVAGSTAVTHHDWANLSVVDAPGASSYPIVEVAYATMYSNLGTAYGSALSFTNATWLVSFFWWLVGNSSTSITPLGFTPLPSAYETIGHSILANETYNSIYLAGDNESGEGGETGEF
ncbi:MAG TPA: hypothetical protein VMG36_03970 [Thermoplasmata archaeon]|nr:hypothetical protein [Thermoplasmata archaeon]